MQIGQPEVVIRRFQARDREEVRSITYNTAFMGEPASVFFEGKELICDGLTLYFTDYEPESCFVAETEGKVVGCLIGAKDKAASEKIINHKIAPRLLRNAVASGALFRHKNFIFISRLLSGVIGGEFKAPDVTKGYPATLHINIESGYCGLNIGSQLIAAFLDYLKQEKIEGVHLATMSDKAAEFFRRLGFNLLHKGKRSYFRHILHRDVPLYIYGRKI